MGSERRSRQNPVAMNKKRIVGSGVGRACWRWRSPMRYGHQAVDPTPRPSQVWYHGRKESHPYLGRPGHLPKGNRTSRYAKMLRGCPGVSRGIVDQSLERLWSCAQHGLNLGGESPLQALQWELLAETKGVHREVESERRSRQNLGPTNRKRI